MPPPASPTAPHGTSANPWTHLPSRWSPLPSRRRPSRALRPPPRRRRGKLGGKPGSLLWCAHELCLVLLILFRLSHSPISRSRHPSTTVPPPQLRRARHHRGTTPPDLLRPLRPRLEFCPSLTQLLGPSTPPIRRRSTVAGEQSEPPHLAVGNTPINRPGPHQTHQSMRPDLLELPSHL